MRLFSTLLIMVCLTGCVSFEDIANRIQNEVVPAIKAEMMAEITEYFSGQIDAWKPQMEEWFAAEMLKAYGEISKIFDHKASEITKFLALMNR